MNRCRVHSGGPSLSADWSDTHDPAFAEASTSSTGQTLDDGTFGSSRTATLRAIVMTE